MIEAPVVSRPVTPSHPPQPLTPPQRQHRGRFSPRGLAASAHATLPQAAATDAPVPTRPTRYRDIQVQPVPYHGPAGAAAGAATAGAQGTGGPPRQGTGGRALEDRARSTQQPKLGAIALAVQKALLAEQENARVRDAVFKAFAEALDTAAGAFRGKAKEVANSLQNRIVCAMQEELGKAFGQGVPPPTPPEMSPTPPDAAHPAGPRDRQRSRPSPSGQSWAQVAATPPAPEAPNAPLLPARSRRPVARRQADKRIFIRVPQDSPAAENHPWAVRGAINKELGDVAQDVRKCPTGFAVTPRDEGARKTLQARLNELGPLLGGRAETATEWYAYIVKRVAAKVRNLQGEPVTVTENMLKEEVQATAGALPLQARWSQREGDGLTRDVIVSFTAPVHRSFCLFGDSAPSRALKPRTRVLQCQRCWAYHDTRSCQGRPRCKRCGRSDCDPSGCTQLERCPNCWGPHEATYEGCALRPKVQKGTVIHPTRREKLAYRRLHARVGGGAGATRATETQATEASRSTAPPATPSAALPSSPAATQVQAQALTGGYVNANNPSSL